MTKKKLDNIVLEKITSDQPSVENIISRIYEILINKVHNPSLLAKLLEPLNDNEYFSTLLETTTPDPKAMQTDLRKYEDLYKRYFKEVIEDATQFLDKDTEVNEEEKIDNGEK